jgi:multiple sugar transport system substrate-binding protein
MSSPNLKAPKEWLECMIETIKIARAGLPHIVAVTEFRDTYGVALTNMITGADPATELKKATDAFRPVLLKTEKG